MRNFFARLGDSIRRFMIGRYGTDDLNRFLNLVFIVLIILEIFIPIRPIQYAFAWITLIILIVTSFRMFSKNIPKRYAENLKFLDLTAGLRRTMRINRRKFNDRKDYRYFKCPGCGQEVRVPKGKGHIRITCPKCGRSFEKKV